MPPRKGALFPGRLRRTDVEVAIDRERVSGDELDVFAFARVCERKRALAGRGGADERKVRYVPDVQDARYSICSGVSTSIPMPIDSSFKRAIS